MARRLGTLLLALVVTGAPAALTACEIVCAARDSRSLPGGSAAHSCHRTQPPDGPGIGTGAQNCGHDEELPAAAAQAAPPSAPAVAVLTSTPLPSMEGAFHPAQVVSSPGHPRLPTPLRI
jgi:hypothetical protein